MVTSDFFILLPPSFWRSGNCRCSSRHVHLYAGISARRIPVGLHNNAPSFRITAPERRIEMEIMRRRDYKYLIELRQVTDRKSTRLNSSHLGSSYAVFCLK